MASNYLVRGRCGLFQAVSKRCETAKILKRKKIYSPVSLFHDFPGRAIGNSNPRFRWFPAQFKLRRLFPRNCETAKQQPISTAKAKSYLFHTALKQLETARNSPRAEPPTV